MTTEEKAKAYDMALEAARKELAIEPIGNTKEVLAEIFPELHESEDEKIRKELIGHCKDLVRMNKDDKVMLSIYKPWLAYLEKQKDASKAIEAVDRIDKYIDDHLANAHDMKDSNPDKKYYRGWDDALGKMAGILQDVYSEKENKFAPRVLPCSAAWFEDGDEKQTEQKPAEWTFPYGVNETVDKLIAIAGCLEMDGDCLFNGYTGTECGKFLRDLARKQVECKPAEWSEEDETKLRDVVRLVEDSGHVKSIREHYEKFLTSLPERFNLQPKQKWNEEDQKMLLSIINDLRNGKVSTIGKEQWLKWLPERFTLQPKQEWSEDFEEAVADLIEKAKQGKCDSLSPIEEGNKLLAIAKHGKVNKPELSEEEEKLLDFWLDVIDRNDWRMDENFCKASREFINRLRSLRPSWKPSEQEKSALRTAIYVLTDERNFPKTAAQLQNILDAFKGEESRKDWKPSEEQMKALKYAAYHMLPGEEYRDMLFSLFKDLKKLM